MPGKNFSQRGQSWQEVSGPFTTPALPLPLPLPLLILPPSSNAHLVLARSLSSLSYILLVEEQHLMTAFLLDQVLQMRTPLGGGRLPRLRMG